MDEVAGRLGARQIRSAVAGCSSLTQISLADLLYLGGMGQGFTGPCGPPVGGHLLNFMLASVPSFCMITCCIEPSAGEGPCSTAHAKSRMQTRHAPSHYAPSGVRGEHWPSMHHDTPGR